MASQDFLPQSQDDQYSEELNYQQNPPGQALKNDKVMSDEIKENKDTDDKQTTTPQTEQLTETNNTAAPTTTSNNTNNPPKEKSTSERLTTLPLARIRGLMKLDPDLQICTLESVFLVTKATELFIESLAREAFVHTAQAKKKTMQKRDVDVAISAIDNLIFLEGAMNF